LIRSSILAWLLRLLVFGGIALLCLWTHSVAPAIGFALTWFPNYPLILVASIGALRLPRRLVTVHAIEPVLYSWAGVGLVKTVVTSRAWRLLVGLEAPRAQTSRREHLQRVEMLTMGAEVVHGTAFIFAASIALICAVTGKGSVALWIAAFNIGLNIYPVMLQRATRWRLQQLR
jgi:hypothetical protein